MSKEEITIIKCILPPTEWRVCFIVSDRSWSGTNWNQSLTLKCNMQVDFSAEILLKL